MSAPIHDIAIIGGGIVGLATALSLSDREGGLGILLLEKEVRLAAHQTGHNSGVIHSGLYYKPGSQKARLCVEGAGLMRAFCQERGIRVEECGKVIVATSEGELPALEALFERGTANGVPDLRLIGPEELAEIEPYACALSALHSPRTAIVDYTQVAEAMAQVLVARGIRIARGRRVLAITSSAQGHVLHTEAGPVSARFLINCAGLHADRVARMCGAGRSLQIIPFRGEYYVLREEARQLVRGLIYPVPDPRFPFLGVHLTRTIHGEVEAGPNAVLAFSREGYDMATVSPGDLFEMLTYGGFWAMARRYLRVGLYEMYRSLEKEIFVRDLRRLVPTLGFDDLVRGGAGVRAQAVLPDGSLCDDFVIERTEGAVHVLNAPSPAATASLAIGRHIAELSLSGVK